MKFFLGKPKRNSPKYDQLTQIQENKTCYTTYDGKYVFIFEDKTKKGKLLTVNITIFQYYGKKKSVMNNITFLFRKRKWKEYLQNMAE